MIDSGEGGQPQAGTAAGSAPASGRAMTTMGDIAALAGVSRSTVSRVLNDAPTQVPIAAQTRDRVIAAARRLGYRPNPLARGLRGAPTMLLGAIVRDFSDPFYGGAIEALAVAAMSHGYNLVLGHAHGVPDGAAALPTVLETRHTDAVVVLGDMQDQPQIMGDLRTAVIPVVTLWQGTSRLEFPSADTDDRVGVTAGLTHLTELGHRRIGFVSADLPGGFRIREDAYADFMRERFGSQPPQRWLVRCPNTLAGGDAALRSLMDRPDPPTAVATSTDLVAVGVLHAAHALGCTVPERLSVVGFDDILISAHTVPALTTLRMPIQEIVRYAADLAITMARDGSRPAKPEKVIFDPTLIVRESTAAPFDAG